MKKLLLTSTLLLAALAHTANAQTWVWTGASSTSWKDSANWVGKDSGLPPDDIGGVAQISGAANTITLDTSASNLPEKQDIEGLEMLHLSITPHTQPLFVSGEKITLYGVINNSVASAFPVVFSNDFAFAAGAGQGESLSPMSFYGRLSEFGGSRRFVSLTGAALVNFYGPVEFTGGFDYNGSSLLNLHGDWTAGGTPASFVPNFFRNMHFNPAPGASWSEYAIHTNKGVNAGTSLTVNGRTVVRFDSLITPVGAAGLTKGGNGILELGGRAMELTGPFACNLGLTIFRGAPAPGGTISTSLRGALDLDGVNLLGRDISFGASQMGPNNDGYLRNQNPYATSRIDGNITSLGGGSTIQFGGVGDILFEGNITHTASTSRFAKTGDGTLRMTGTSLYPGITAFLGGTVVLDHGDNNAPKIGQGANLKLYGNLVLLGNKQAGTTNTVAAVNGDLGNIPDPDTLGFANRIRISPAGQNGNNSVFRFSTFGSNVHNPVDFAPGEDGHILTSGMANNANLKTLPIHFTFGGESFARVAAGADAEGYCAIERLPTSAYSNAFVTGTAIAAALYEFVDIANNLVHAVGDVEIAAALRFNTPGASLTLDNNLQLRGEGANYAGTAGGILVTSNVGKHDVEINAIGANAGINMNASTMGYLNIHQHNTNGALVINIPINVVGQFSNGHLLKTGPGGLVLNNPGNAFKNVLLYEGVLTVNSVATNGVASALGQGPGLVVGNATLRYKGVDPAGHKTDRQITLRGPAVLDASGAGPLTFTNPRLFSNTSSHGGNHVVTLSGNGRGVIQGTLEVASADWTDAGVPWIYTGNRLWKKGPGTWTLKAASESVWVYGAEIFDGTLVLNGAFGRDITVHDGGTLAGSGTVVSDLLIEDGATLSLSPSDDPNAPVFTVGRNLRIADGAVLSIPRKIPSHPVPVLKVAGKVIGQLKAPDHVFLSEDNGVFYAAFRPTGTLLLVR